MPPGCSTNTPKLRNNTAPKPATPNSAPPMSTRKTAKKEALHSLAASGTTTSVDAARVLLEKGANPRAPDKNGQTPLHYACAHDHVAMVQLLLHFGCDPMCTDKLGRTALSVAKGNSLRFLRRYQKKDKKQRLNIFRRFFACHSRHHDTFYVVKKDKEERIGQLHPQAMAVAESVSFNRGNVVQRSYRHAKMKIRTTLNVFAKHRSRTNSEVGELQDVVMTSEGLRTVDTPSRVAAGKPKDTGPKRSMSAADLFVKIPDRRAIEAENKRLKTRKPVETTPRRARAGRSKTPDMAPKTRRTPARRSKSQEKIVDLYLKVPQKQQPRHLQELDKPNIPAPRVQPSAPPLSPSPPPPPKREQSGERDKSGLTAYYTADDESIEILANAMKKVQIGGKKRSKSAEPTPLTPSTVDDGEMRKIRRLRDGELKMELKKYGISPAGPLDARMRRLYEKRLLGERMKVIGRGYSPDVDLTDLKYSPQLELVIKSSEFPKDVGNRARKLDENVRKEFSGDGHGYTAFCYLIMDPRILGRNVDSITFSKFVESIFYVGKGSKNRPLAHFIDCRNERRENSSKLKTNEKLRKIDELWTLGHGIPRHEISHGVSDEEAFVREASLIEAITIKNLSNKKGGEYHGSTRNWDTIMKAEFGAFILNTAFTTLKAEGIRLIHEERLPESIYPNITNRRTPKTPK